MATRYRVQQNHRRMMEIIDKERIEILKQDLEEDFKDVYQELLTLYENDFAPQKSRLADEIAT